MVDDWVSACRGLCGGGGEGSGAGVGRLGNSV